MYLWSVSSKIDIIGLINLHTEEIVSCDRLDTSMMLTIDINEITLQIVYKLLPMDEKYVSFWM